jgi:hypothetical protein
MVFILILVVCLTSSLVNVGYYPTLIAYGHSDGAVNWLCIYTTDISFLLEIFLSIVNF